VKYSDTGMKQGIDFFLIDSHGYNFYNVYDKLYSKQSTDTIN